MNHDDLRTLDTLVDRVATGEASAQEWTNFEQRAATERDLWERVVRTARAEQCLRADFGRALLLVEGVALPALPAAPFSVPPRTTRRPWLALVGWAAAAVLGVLLLRTPTERPLSLDVAESSPVADRATQSVADPSSNSPESSSTPQWTEVQRSPRVVLQTRPGPTAEEVEVWTLCTTVEHAVVDRLFQFAHDDAGEAKAVPVSPLALAGAERL